MIARIWHGTTPADKAEAYDKIIERTGITDLRNTEGNRGAWCFRRVDGDIARFTVLSLWDDMEAIKRFAGPDPRKAFYYPEDNDYLLEFAPHVEHFEVVAGGPQ